jgi:hypothetical protein
MAPDSIYNDSFSYMDAVDAESKEAVKAEMTKIQLTHPELYAAAMEALNAAIEDKQRTANIVNLILSVTKTVASFAAFV